MIWHIGEIFFLHDENEIAAPLLSEWFERHLGDVVSVNEWHRLALLPQPELDPQ